MLSKTRLRDQTEQVRRRLATRGLDGTLLDAWLEADAKRRGSLTELEEFKRQRNEASKAIGQLKQQGGDTEAEIARVSELKGRIEELDQLVTEADGILHEIEAQLPNLPHESVPVGADESANRVETVVGEATSFDFPPQEHWDLGPALGILDFERGAKVAGARFTTYVGLGARLERALAAFMLDLQVDEHGYQEVIPPYVVNSQALFGTGQLPKFKEDLFHLEGTDYYLIPTAEVPVTNLHRDEQLAEEDLPKRFVAFTPCFRAEAGSYGKDVRGLIRQHQFHKVELVHLCVEEASYDELELLTENAETVLQKLELPYRRVCLSTGDMGFSAAKTYDLEVWLPAQEAYREISSCSNCEDFQARRANLRYRSAADGKLKFAHTLNGSALAVGRTLVAVLENYQNQDGTITVPEVLRPYMGGVERIEAV